MPRTSRAYDRANGFPMGATSPNFADWCNLAAIEIREIAVLMHGIDPRALTDVTVADPHDPSDRHGVPLDSSWEERMIISAVQAQTVISAPPGVTAPNSRTAVNKSSLIPWLRALGHSVLADGLEGGPITASAGNPPGTKELPDPERRLAALRALGGTAKWKRYRDQQQQWRFTKIKELVKQEVSAGRNRSDEKTIRKDLAEAAQAENIAKKRADLS